MLRQIGQKGLQVSQKALTTTAVRASSQVSIVDGQQLPQALKDKYYAKLGNRDIVGPGYNGWPVYQDREDFPCPAIRFGENSAQFMALREKEKGDWSKLSIDDKKALYRSNYRETFQEMGAPTGEWRSIIAAVLLGCSITGWLMIWLKLYVLQPLPSTITDPEYVKKEVELMLKQRQGAIQGISSKWDYEKGQWK